MQDFNPLNVISDLIGRASALAGYAYSEKLISYDASLTDEEKAEFPKRVVVGLSKNADIKEVRAATVQYLANKIETDNKFEYLAGYALMLANGHDPSVMTIERSIADQLECELISEKYRKQISAVRDAIKSLEDDGKFFDKSLKLKYLGLRTLYDRYLLRKYDGTLCESPQMLFLRVAVATSAAETDYNSTATCLKAFYGIISDLKYMPSTPTLFNSGTNLEQLSSCYVLSIEDSLDSIYGLYAKCATLAKYAGGLGCDFTPIRGTGALIKGTNGPSQGVIPFVKVLDSSTVAVNQGGKRKGATCVYLEVFHPDIESFLELKKNTGDDRRRAHDMNTALWISDLFMKRVQENGTWSLFQPITDGINLHDLHGEDFEREYTRLESEGKFVRQLPAMDLWKKMVNMIYETGHPWMCFKDACNAHNPMKKVETVRSSNLCTEITLGTSEDVVATCNLGSINLLEMFKVIDGKLVIPDPADATRTVHAAVRMLDNVISITDSGLEAVNEVNRRRRPTGLGIMGTADFFMKYEIPFESAEAVEFSGAMMMFIHNTALQASRDIAAEKGAFPDFADSTYDQEHPMRNSNVTAIAPTVTISNIVGVSASIEPLFSNLYTKSNLSGDFTKVNPYLISSLKKIGKWDKKMLQSLKKSNGSVVSIKEIPSNLKKVFKTAFEMDPHAVVKHAQARTPYVSQAQSTNLYVSNPTGKTLSDLYMDAWKSGLKTTYYLRTTAASQAEKISVEDDSTLTQVKACSIENPDCEACQ